MGDADTLYQELQADFNLISCPLFELAEMHLRKRDQFLPFGAILDDNGGIGIQAATSGAEFESSLEVLPVLQSGLRAIIEEGGISAIGICEWVKITQEGSEQTDAMKVLVEHKRGLTVAFYVPCQKDVVSGWAFEEMFARQAEPEVRGWDLKEAS